jgi:hypothetical protein
VAEEHGGRTLIAVFVDLWLDGVPAIVHHTHCIPARLFWLRVLEDIPSADGYTFRLEQTCRASINMPMNPRPELIAVPDGIVRELAGAIEPRLAFVQRDFDALHFVSATVVCSAFDAVGVSFADLIKSQLLALRGLDDDGIEVLLIARSVRMVEHGGCEFAILLSDEAGQDAIVPDVVIRVVLFFAHPNPLQPFDAATTNVPWYDDSKGISVIWRQDFIVHLVRQKNIIGRIHCIS